MKVHNWSEYGKRRKVPPPRWPTDLGLWITTHYKGKRWFVFKLRRWHVSATRLYHYLNGTGKISAEVLLGICMDTGLDMRTIAEQAMMMRLKKYPNPPDWFR